MSIGLLALTLLPIATFVLRLLDEIMDTTYRGLYIAKIIIKSSLGFPVTRTLDRRSKSWPRSFGLRHLSLRVFEPFVKLIIGHLFLITHHPMLWLWLVPTLTTIISVAVTISWTIAAIIHPIVPMTVSVTSVINPIVSIAVSVTSLRGFVISIAVAITSLSGFVVSIAVAVSVSGPTLKGIVLPTGW